MSEDKDINFKPTVTTEDYLDVATPPAPGNRPVVPKPSGRPIDPKLSPHFKEGDNPVWIACRATPDCEGKYAAQRISGERNLEAGGGSWLRYQCLTCGRPFHFTR